MNVRHIIELFADREFDLMHALVTLRFRRVIDDERRFADLLGRRRNSAAIDEDAPNFGSCL